MLLIYTQKVTPRVTYTFRQVLGNILGLQIEFTSKVEDFIAHKGMKFSYGKKKMGNELFVKAAGLLTQQGLSETEMPVRKWDKTPCFYRVGDESDIPFDIFSASFYMLSRYEEYLPHVKDGKGRYPAKESLAYKKEFLQKPVVDLWAYKFKSILQERFPKAGFPVRKFKTTNVLAVAEVYKYRAKGMMRNFGGAFYDLFHFRFGDILERIKTLLFLTKDPYDVYEKLLSFSKQNDINWEFMFQLSDYSLRNKNIGHNKLKYHALIKSMGDYGKIGLLLGYEALHSLTELKKEKKRWESIVNRDLDMALSDEYDLNLPQLYNNYDTLEIGWDYSMGFSEEIGFRAGTCTPFLYYDLNFERISPLVLKPTACNSSSFETSLFLEVERTLEQVKSDVEKVNGNLIMIYKNSDFEESEHEKKYFQLLEKMNEH